MHPTLRLIGLLAAWNLLGLIPIIWPGLNGYWFALGGLLAVFATLDAWELRHRALPSVTRRTATVLPLGVWSEVTLRLHNSSARPYRLEVFDHYPQPAELLYLPRSIVVTAGGWTEIRYGIRPLERGEFQFGRVQTLLISRFGLWRRPLWLGEPLPIRVYPDFAAVAHYMLFSTRQRIGALGIHRRRRRGEGQEFHQLREYRLGDTLRQIDWKATARTCKLISREYQEERDQTVVFLLDCSRRMRARDGALSHFDHALNALLLLSYVALQQGDAVSVHCFGGEGRWLPPHKGRGFLATLIDTVYNLQPSLQPADYAQAAALLLARQRKRALVVLLTNLRDEDSEELQTVLQGLSRRHLFLLASLRERILGEIMHQPVQDFQQARLYAATCDYLAARRRCQDKFRQLGSLLLEAEPQELPAALVNRYLEIKRGGRL
ncbi:MAG TPA: DUF58 domain-containing protein [Candidatus Competibacteraceae bacterium]|nr:DUF58 domain-containing protein [Candidatus Competibacteraceae bacterium]